jgi:hypothetical protein
MPGGASGAAFGAGMGSCLRCAAISGNRDGGDYFFADTRPDKATITYPAALYPEIFNAIEARISFQSFTNDPAASR